MKTITDQIEIQSLSLREAEWLLVAIKTTIENQLNETEASRFLANIGGEISKKITNLIS